MSNNFDYQAMWNLTALSLAFEDVHVTCRHWRDKNEPTHSRMFSNVSIEGSLRIVGEKPIPLMVMGETATSSNFDAQRVAASNAIEIIERDFSLKLPFNIRSLSKIVGSMPRFPQSELDLHRREIGFILA